VRNPLRSEDAAFGLLLRVALGAALVVALVLLARVL